MRLYTNYKGYWHLTNAKLKAILFSTQKVASLYHTHIRRYTNVSIAMLDIQSLHVNFEFLGNKVQNFTITQNLLSMQIPFGTTNIPNSKPICKSTEKLYWSKTQKKGNFTIRLCMRDVTAPREISVT